MKKDQDLFQFLSQHGLAKEVEGEDVEERHASFLRVNAPNERRLIHCKGCGAPIIHLAGDLNNESQSEYERTIEFHMKCYQEAIYKMNRLQKDVDYKDERRQDFND